MFGQSSGAGRCEHVVQAHMEGALRLGHVLKESADYYALSQIIITAPEPEDLALMPIDVELWANSDKFALPPLASAFFQRVAVYPVVRTDPCGVEPPARILGNHARVSDHRGTRGERGEGPLVQRRSSGGNAALTSDRVGKRVRMIQSLYHMYFKDCYRASPAGPAAAARERAELAVQLGSRTEGQNPLKPFGSSLATLSPEARLTLRHGRFGLVHRRKKAEASGGIPSRRVCHGIEGANAAEESLQTPGVRR
jgi:hypothetical protein